MTQAELEQWMVLAKCGDGRVRRFHEFMKGFASVPSSRDLILTWANVMVAAGARIGRSSESRWGDRWNRSLSNATCEND